MTDQLLKSEGDLQVILEDDAERRGKPRGGEHPDLQVPKIRLVWSRHDSPKTPRLYRLHVYLQPESEGGFSVRVGQLPGTVSQGESVAEALAMIREAVAGVLEAHKEEGQDIPWVEDDGPRHEDERRFSVVVDG